MTWLFDVVPPDYRLHGVLRRHPYALAVLARHHIAACIRGAREGYRSARTELGGKLPPGGVEAVLEVYRAEGSRLVETARAVDLVGRALRGEVFMPQLGGTQDERRGPRERSTTGRDAKAERDASERDAKAERDGKTERDARAKQKAGERDARAEQDGKSERDARAEQQAGEQDAKSGRDAGARDGKDGRGGQDDRDSRDNRDDQAERDAGRRAAKPRRGAKSARPR